MGHSRLSPSKSSRVLLCAASPAREELFPDEVGNNAKAGTNQHWLAEQAFKDETWPPHIMKQEMPMVQAVLPEPEVDLTPEMIENARLYYEYVQRRAAELKPSVLRIEERVSPSTYTGREDSDGTVDAAVVSDTIIEVIDFKTGGVQVEPDAPQLKLYALGLMAQYADPLSGLPKAKTIRLTVFQPPRPGMDTIERFEDFTPNELIDWAVSVWLPAAQATDDPNAKATPSEDACRYCKAAKNGACPEYTAFMERSAAQLFQPIEQQAVARVESNVDLFMGDFKASNLSSEQIAIFLEAWPLMKARAADIEDEALKRLKEHHPIPGFKAVNGRGSRAWAHDAEEQAKKFRNMKIKKADIFEEKLRSPAQLLARDLPTKTKEAIKKHIINKPGSLTVVPVSDKRKDALPAVEFQPVAEQTPAESETNKTMDLSFLGL